MNKILPLLQESDGHLLWTAAKTKNGYGVVRHNGRNQYVHRLYHELMGRVIPKGQVIRHSCPHKHCVRHIETGTYEENNGADRVRDGTSNQGERHGMSKLTAEKVVEIRALREQGYELKMIAEMFDVSAECISQIARGVLWSHVHPVA
jgi:hypothetical protein